MATTQDMVGQKSGSRRSFSRGRHVSDIPVSGQLDPQSQPSDPDSMPVHSGLFLICGKRRQSRSV